MVDIGATGARMNGQVRDLGGGDYQAAFSPGSNQAIPSPAWWLAGNPLSRVVLLADNERLSSAVEPPPVSRSLLSTQTGIRSPAFLSI